MFRNRHDPNYILAELYMIRTIHGPNQAWPELYKKLMSHESSVWMFFGSKIPENFHTSIRPQFVNFYKYFDFKCPELDMIRTVHDPNSTWSERCMVRNVDGTNFRWSEVVLKMVRSQNGPNVNVSNLNVSPTIHGTNSYSKIVQGKMVRSCGRTRM